MKTWNALPKAVFMLFGRKKGSDEAFHCSPLTPVGLDLSKPGKWTDSKTKL